MTEAPPPRRTTALAAIVVVLAFLAGGVLGVIGDRTWLFRHRFNPSPEGMRFAAQRILNRLDRELDFTLEQRKAVEQILERRTQHIRAIWSTVQPQMRQEIDQSDAEIEKLLTPEQKEKFTELRKRMRRRHPL